MAFPLLLALGAGGAYLGAKTLGLLGTAMGGAGVAKAAGASASASGAAAAGGAGGAGAAGAIAPKAPMKLPANLELGKQVMAGNAAGGLESYAQNKLGPQIEFAQSLSNPDANSFDAFMKMQMESKTRPVGMPQLPSLAQGPVGPQGMPTQQRGMPIAQGLPQGLLQQLGYQR